jgi:hypothetical protein
VCTTQLPDTSTVPVRLAPRLPALEELPLSCAAGLFKSRIESESTWRLLALLPVLQRARLMHQRDAAAAACRSSSCS